MACDFCRCKCYRSLYCFQFLSFSFYKLIQLNAFSNILIWNTLISRSLPLLSTGFWKSRSCIELMEPFIAQCIELGCIDKGQLLLWNVLRCQEVIHQTRHGCGMHGWWRQAGYHMYNLSSVMMDGSHTVSSKMHLLYSHAYFFSYSFSRELDFYLNARSGFFLFNLEISHDQFMSF